MIDYSAMTDDELIRMWLDQDLRRAGYRRPPPPESRPPLVFRPRRTPPPENVDRTGFLLQRALRAYRLLLWELFDELGMLPSQETLLVEIYYGRDVDPQASLARRAHSSRASIARSLRRLERAGMVERERAPGDRRYHVVRLTELGEMVIRRGGEALREAEKTAFEDLPPRVRRVFEQALLHTETVCLATVRSARERPPSFD